MSGLLSSMNSAGNALNVLQEALNVVQTNVTNASTPGYATQQANLTAQPMDIAAGLTGGVAFSGVQSTSDSYANSEVQRQLQTLGQYTAQSQGTSALQSFFDVTGSSGVSAALSQLYQSFSAWSVSPDTASAQQQVLSSAGTLASSVQSLSGSLANESQQLDTQIGSSVSQINALAGQIQQYNVQRQQDQQPDPGADANLEANLESLSQLVNFTTVTQSDGTVTVLLGGSAPLVNGDQAYPLSVQNSVTSPPPPANPNSPPSSHIMDSQGNDITAEITGGQLGGTLDVRNNVLGSIVGDAQQAGTLNQFAQGLADTVNQILTSGTVSTATGAAKGTALFTYNASDATLAAQTLEMNPSITASQLAPVDASGNSNGNANALAALATQTTGTGSVNGMSYTSYFGEIASNLGTQAQTAQTNETAQQAVSAQAQSLRDSISKVSLDVQATTLLQYQRSYQAVAQVLTTLNTLTESLLAVMPPSS
jgi:flagellar hook-associated protein 1 FlgK